MRSQIFSRVFPFKPMIRLPVRRISRRTGDFKRFGRQVATEGQPQSRPQSDRPTNPEETHQQYPTVRSVNPQSGSPAQALTNFFMPPRELMRSALHLPACILVSLELSAQEPEGTRTLFGTTLTLRRHRLGAWMTTGSSVGDCARRNRPAHVHRTAIQHRRNIGGCASRFGRAAVTR